MSVELELIGRVAEMLDSAGWAIEVDRAKDGLQLDIYAAKDSSPALVIECKAYRKLLGLRTAREFASVVGFLRESTPELQAWLVTTNGFTPNAARALQEHQIRGFTISELAQQFGPKKNRVSKDRSTWAADADIARKKKQRVFVIMPFDEQMLDVFILGIRWAASKLEIVAERSDDLEHHGEIIGEIKTAIQSYDVIVGDTSGANPNVCYELGYAHALDRPTILICRKGEKLPFDLQGTNHLFYSNILELREPLKEKLETALGLRRASRSSQEP